MNYHYSFYLTWDWRRGTSALFGSCTIFALAKLTAAPITKAEDLKCWDTEQGHLEKLYLWLFRNLSLGKKTTPIFAAPSISKRFFLSFISLKNIFFFFFFSEFRYTWYFEILQGSEICPKEIAILTIPSCCYEVHDSAYPSPHEHNKILGCF